MAAKVDPSHSIRMIKFSKFKAILKPTSLLNFYLLRFFQTKRISEIANQEQDIAYSRRCIQRFLHKFLLLKFPMIAFAQSLLNKYTENQITILPTAITPLLFCKCLKTFSGLIESSLKIVISYYKGLEASSSPRQKAFGEIAESLQAELAYGPVGNKALSVFSPIMRTEPARLETILAPLTPDCNRDKIDRKDQIHSLFFSSSFFIFSERLCGLVIRR